MGKPRIFLYDVESYPSDFLIVFKEPNGSFLVCDRNNYVKFLDSFKPQARDFILIGFNNRVYDRHVFNYILDNYDKMSYAELSAHTSNITQHIITSGNKDRSKRVPLTVPGLTGIYSIPKHTNDLDISEYSGNNRESLKTWEIKTKMSKVISLPFPPSKESFSDAEYSQLTEYCKHDVEAVHRIFMEREDGIMGKLALIEKFFDSNYSMVVDADRGLVEKILNKGTSKPRLNNFKYVSPIRWDFHNPEMLSVMQDMESTEWYGDTAEQRVLDSNGKPMFDENRKPITFQNKNTYSKSVKIDDFVLTFGAGGIHGSIDRSVQEDVIDIDFASFYPWLMVNFKYYNPQLLTEIELLETMVRDRVKLKKTDPFMAAVYKLIINKIYGALGYVSGEKHGSLYDIKSQLSICFTGQLTVANLIDRLVVAGYKMVYANTDGISFRANGSDDYKRIVEDVAKLVNIEIEYNHYAKLWLKDTNNYVALKDDNSIKAKGEYDLSFGKKNSVDGAICYQSVIDFLVKGIPIADNINSCNDPYMFSKYHSFDKKTFTAVDIYDEKGVADLMGLIDRINEGSDEQMPEGSYFGNIRYMLGNYSLKNKVYQVRRDKENRWFSKAMESTDNIIDAMDMDAVNMNSVNRHAYITLANGVLDDLLPDGYAKTEKSIKMIATIDEHMGVDHSALLPGYGKIKAVGKGLWSPLATSIHILTGVKSDVLILDVDDPYSKGAKTLLTYIKRDMLIIRSSKYTLDDVFAGKCKYKVAFKFKGGTNLPIKKKNVAIECFYSDRKTVAIAGSRGDGYEYVITGNLTDLCLNINDVLENKVDEFGLNGNKAKKVKKPKVGESDETPFESDGTLDVDIYEFKRFISGEISTPINIVKKTDKLLTFPCVFNHMHTKKNNAGATKHSDGSYHLFCMGTVCREHYNELNARLRSKVIAQDTIPDKKGFGVAYKTRVVVLQAPTGWGKTEKIAEEMVRALNLKNDRIIVVCPNKEAIRKTLERFDFAYGANVHQTLVDNGTIYKMISEETTELKKDAVRAANARIIIVHHNYISNAGDAITTYNQAKILLAQKDCRIFIDEAHSYIEMATRFSIQTGGLYNILRYHGWTTYRANHDPLTEQAVREKISNDSMIELTKCIEPGINMLKQFKMNFMERIRETDTHLLDVQKIIEDNFEKTDSIKEGNIEYTAFRNPSPYQVNFLAEKKEYDENDLIFPADYFLLAYNTPDNIRRKKAGQTHLSIQHHQLFHKFCNNFKSCMLISATFTNYHRSVIDTMEATYYEIEQKISKVKKIIMLRPQEWNSSIKFRDNIIDYMNGLTDKDGKPVKALFLMPTIADAEELLTEHANVRVNKNGITMLIQKRWDDDYSETDRNITAIGAEAAPAKGVNYSEEVDVDAPGFKMIYIHSPPVSPDMIKKSVVNGKIEAYNHDHITATFAQGIGRAFRKPKDILVIAINNTDETTYNLIKELLARETNAEIIEDRLDMFNVEIALGNPKIMQAALQGSELYQRLYGGKSSEIPQG